MWACFVCGNKSYAQTPVCSSCGNFNTMISLPTVNSGNNISDTKIVPISYLFKQAKKLKKYSSLSITLPKIFSMLIYGMPGTGKTTTMLAFCDELVQEGYRVLYNALEEGFSISMRQKIERLEIMPEKGFDICCINNVEVLLESLANYDCIVFDTLDHSSFTPEDLARIQREYDIAICFTLHCRKDGIYKGDSGYGHWVDLIIHTPKFGFMEIQKNRYQEVEHGKEFELPFLSRA